LRRWKAVRGFLLCLSFGVAGLFERSLLEGERRIKGRG